MLEGQALLKSLRKHTYSLHRDQSFTWDSVQTDL